MEHDAYERALYQHETLQDVWDALREAASALTWDGVQDIASALQDAQRQCEVQIASLSRDLDAYETRQRTLEDLSYQNLVF